MMMRFGVIYFLATLQDSWKWTVLVSLSLKRMEISTPSDRTFSWEWQVNWHIRSMPYLLFSEVLKDMKLTFHVMGTSSHPEVFLTPPASPLWSLTAALRYRFWRRVNIPVSIQEGFSRSASEFRDVVWQAVRTCDSGGALNVMWNLFGLEPFFEPNKKNLTFQFYIQTLERFQSCCMSCHVATMEVLVCHNMTTYLLIASWLAHHSVWVGAGARQNSVAFLLLKKHASIFMCAMVKR